MWPLPTEVYTKEILCLCTAHTDKERTVRLVVNPRLSEVTPADKRMKTNLLLVIQIEDTTKNIRRAYVGIKLEVDYPSQITLPQMEPILARGMQIVCSDFDFSSVAPECQEWQNDMDVLGFESL